jgi:tetratricopeptide (TPR) repeat protein
MTPRIFTDRSGVPFPATVLDARAGMATPRGTFSLAPRGESVAVLPAECFAEVEGLCAEGKVKLEAGDLQGAFDCFADALERVPEPVHQWNAGAWILVAMGECGFRAGNYAAALDSLTDAMHAPGTIGNPWVHLRLGQCLLNLGEEERAADELARAYRGGGRGIFEGQDPRCFAMVEKVLRPPPGTDRLP